MKAVFAFFLFFFFQLLGGSAHAAGFLVRAPLQYAIKESGLKTVHAAQDCLLEKTDGSGEECVELPFLDDNDEQELIKKQTTLVRCLFALTHIYFTTLSDSSRTVPLFSGDQLFVSETHRYLLIQVFRI